MHEFGAKLIINELSVGCWRSEVEIVNRRSETGESGFEADGAITPVDLELAQICLDFITDKAAMAATSESLLGARGSSHPGEMKDS